MDPRTEREIGRTLKLYESLPDFVARCDFSSLRRGGRVVECSGLENRRTRKGSVSSNLTHAAESTMLTRFSGHR